MQEKFSMTNLKAEIAIENIHSIAANESRLKSQEQAKTEPTLPSAFLPYAKAS